MKNKLPNKNEWNEIAEKAFSDYEEHRFSERYLQKKDEIKRGAVMKRTFIDPEKMFIGLTAAAVLAVAAVPTAILIGSRNNSSDKDEKQYSAESIELTAKREKGTYRIPSEVGIPEKDLDIYGIGDTLALGDDGVSITIDNACIQDDLGDFTKLRMGESGYYPLDCYPNLSPYDENGKLSVYYEWFGENDTEKSCGKDTVPLKVMVVEATIRNNSDTSYSKYAMDPVLFTVQNGFAGGLRQAFKGDSIAAAHSDIMGYEIDRVSSYMVSGSSPIDDVKTLSDDDYYFSSIPREDGDGGKMLFELEAGHAEKVKIAFMFNEDFVGNLYFKLSPRYTLAAEPTGDTDCRVVDLCGIGTGISIASSEVETPTEASPTYTEEGGRVILPADVMKSFAVGETISVDDKLITLDKVWLQDDFDGITTDNVGKEKDYSSYLYNGKLASSGIIAYYKLNEDGSSEKLSERYYDTRILVAELTYTNPTDSAKEYCISQNLWNMNEQGTEILSLAINFPVKTEADLDLLCNREGPFSFSSDKSSFANNIELAPGESANVKLAFIVEEPELEKLYLCAATDGTNQYCYDLCNIK